MTNRCVKWSKEAQEFFESAADNSLVLDVVISHACLSQTGEGFEELVNSINALKRKIKRVNITDTSYLYRHCIPNFTKYSDTNIPTMWFLENKDTISKIENEVVIKSWADGVNNNEFKRWHKQIKTDFVGDEDGKGLIQEFKDMVLREASAVAYKNGYNLGDCIDFILEECVYTCVNFQNAILVYPVEFISPIMNAIERYNIKILMTTYKISQHAQQNSKSLRLDSDLIDKRIALFMKEEVTNVNFFVIDRHGNHIYKNYACNGDDNAKWNQKTWRTTVNVMKTKKQVIDEEESIKGENYLTVKSPLMINDQVEGIIGLAINITDRKKAEQLEHQNELQKIELDYQSKIKIVSEQVAHDIRSPLAILSMLADNCKELSEKDHISLRNAITNIESIANNLLDEYEKYEKLSIQKDVADQYVSPNLSLQAIINDKRYQYKKSNVTFNYSHDPTHDFAFIKGSYPDFCRMMSNLLNNSVEAVEEGKKGIVEVGFIIKNHKVEFYIKDNGKGMSQEVVDKIMNDIPVDSSKQGGYGIGMQQIKQTLQAMNGRMSIESMENVGTEITLIFPESDPPKWFPMQITLHKGDTVVVLDDDPSIHDAWKRRFAGYANDVTVKYFTNGRETIDFINSFKEIDKIFLLADYELRGQKIDGVDVIEKSCVYNRSIIVTSAYASKIRDFNQKSKFIKMFPKAYINEIPITITDEKTKIVDFVFIDDNESLANALCSSLEARSLKADAYNSADVFLNNLHKYSKDTKIVADHELKQGGNGFDLLEKLYERGYSKLYLMSGRNFENKNPPPYVTVLLKEGAIIEKLLANS